MSEHNNLTWKELKELMKDAGVKDSDIIDDVGLYPGSGAKKDRATVYREKLGDGKFHISISFSDTPTN